PPRRSPGRAGHYHARRSSRSPSRTVGTANRPRSTRRRFAAGASGGARSGLETVVAGGHRMVSAHVPAARRPASATARGPPLSASHPMRGLRCRVPPPEVAPARPPGRTSLAAHSPRFERSEVRKPVADRPHSRYTWAMTEITAAPGEAGPGRATAGPHHPGQISQGTTADWPAIAELMAMTFHGSPEDEAGAEAVFEPDRSLLIRDGDEIVAHAAAYTRDLTVPGAVLPAAHVTMVGVAPTHRRQGMLTRLMHRQLAEVPEPIAVLWASEGRIYPRFGYGMASQRVSLEIETREVRLPAPATAPGRVRTVPADAARPRLRDVYEAVRADRPGLSSRDDRWWGRRLEDPPGHREGATALRVSLHDSGDGPDGYA